MVGTMARINPLGILAATLAVSVLGGVWFTVLFGKAYSAVLGRKHDPSAKPTPLYFVGPAVCMLVTVVTSAYLMKILAISSLSSALEFGAVIGLGYLGANAVNMGINPLIARPIAYGMLSAAYFFMSSILISVTLFWLR